MVKLYIVRHGESNANKKDVFVGHADVDLTENGALQAEITADFLKDKNIDAVYSSDLIRAYRTACATAKRLNLPVIKDKGLREIDGGLWEEVPYEQLKQRFPNGFNTFLNDMDNAVIEGGESVAGMTKRFACTIKEIAEKNNGKTVAIFAHASTIRCFYAYCTGALAQNVSWPNNASVTEVDYENGVFNVIKYGYDGFIGELKTGLPEKI